MLIDYLAFQLFQPLREKEKKKILEFYSHPKYFFDAEIPHAEMFSKKLCALRTEAIAQKQQWYEKAEREMELADQKQIHLTAWNSPDYPVLLKECADPPLVLYVRGNPNLNQGKYLSIVGTRKATSYGEIMCESLIRELQVKDLNIVSGLALGIDGLAHRYSLKYHIPTLAVLATSVDIIYPGGHVSLATEILEKGGSLISEQPFFTPPHPKLFPKRNRIIAGLSEGTVIVEAGIKGGALISAKIAHSYQRSVMAVPGNCNQTYSMGCNKILKQQMAVLVENAKDICDELNWDQDSPTLTPPNPPIKATRSKNTSPHWSIAEKNMMEILKKYPNVSLDSLVLICGDSVQNLLNLLFSLEMKGAIVQRPGNFYKLAENQTV